MLLTPKIQKAINIAAEKHFGQNRKGKVIPYIVHPFAVAWILSNYTNDDNIITAALMHDVLEDVKGYSFDDLKNDLGAKIAKIVEEVSEDIDPNMEDPKVTWDYRKQKYLNDLIHESYEAMMITAADKIHNLNSLVDNYTEQGDQLWEKFNAPIDKKLWFYGEVLSILKSRLNNEIVREYEKQYKKAVNLILHDKKS
jgi:(p)ppGpp synthase/HD superfamily hydrolase